MRLHRTTKKHLRYWRNRKIDWKAQYQNADHPHRFMIIGALKSFNWYSLIEIGCGAGANLIRIAKSMPGKQLGGMDASKDAIDACNTTFRGGIFKVNTGDDIMLSDKATDVTLTDMFLIYVGPLHIDRYIKEIKRVTRNNLVLCEFHHKSFWKRFILRWKWGYNAYDYKKLLTKHGFRDIQTIKVPVGLWPEEPQQTYAHIIMASPPQKQI